IGGKNKGTPAGGHETVGERDHSAPSRPRDPALSGLNPAPGLEPLKVHRQMAPGAEANPPTLSPPALKSVRPLLLRSPKEDTAASWRTIPRDELVRRMSGSQSQLVSIVNRSPLAKSAPPELEFKEPAPSQRTLPR